MEDIKIRKASEEDLMLYFNWANDPVVRANAINKGQIAIEDHTKWFYAKLKSSATYLFVFEIKGKPLGQVRFDIEEGSAEIDYSLDKNFRGQGLGKTILSAAIVELGQIESINVIQGIIKSENIASIKVFESLGFLKKDSTQKDDERYEKFSLTVSSPSIVIANSNPIHRDLERYFLEKFQAKLIKTKEELTTSILNMFNPAYVFFPHWSSIIPKEVYENYQCVVFHMTDLPYGRGGSPLQNLIVRGHKDTMISAIQVTKGLDTGDVYLKRPLSLAGSANEIFLRAGNIMIEMIEEIIKTKPTPIPQTGEVVNFKRRKPSEGDISRLDDLEKVHDFIRMLDAEGYPNAFLDLDNFRLEFSDSNFNNDEIISNVRIIKK